jgi:hypothetical protein
LSFDTPDAMIGSHMHVFFVCIYVCHKYELKSDGGKVLDDRHGREMTYSFVCVRVHAWFHCTALWAVSFAQIHVAFVYICTYMCVVKFLCFVCVHMQAYLNLDTYPNGRPPEFMRHPNLSVSVCVCVCVCVCGYR